MHNDAPALLAVFALHELSVFQSTAADAQFAPTAADTIDLSRLAGYSLDSFEQLSARVTELGFDVSEFAQTYIPAFQAFHERTKPQDWYESLMKSYVHNGLLRDYTLSTIGHLDADSRKVATAVVDDTRQDEYLRERLVRGISEDETLGWRLALWGRKLVFETLERLADLPLKAIDASEHDRAWAQALSQHSRRMNALGLTA